jgi:hypothetical protein
MVDVLRHVEWRRWLTLGVALVILDASLTFRNVWPTPLVTWRGDLSIELAACLAAMTIAAWHWGPPSRTALRWLAAAWVVLVAGRYADVTAPALYGREVNLYWDLRHVSAVASMLARVASPRLIALLLAATILVPLVIYAPIFWALRQVGKAMARAQRRVTLGVLACTAVLLFVVQQLGGPIPAMPSFARPVTRTFWHQTRLMTAELTSRGERSLGSGPSFDADLAAVRGADVLLIFMESYGAVTYDRPEFAEPLRASRTRFEADVRESGRDMVSAFVESPTFGGSSWLAHVSLLSGIEVRDEDTNVRLMARKRDTLVTAFARHGYRTIALMPGLHQSWPEGQFYGFDEIVGEERLGYRGPPFGWWTVPDQFAIARLDAGEIAPQPRAPVFAFFPTTGTHTPFSPTAPYQPDWARVLTEGPYEQADIERAWEEVPDWLNLGPDYVRALSYSYTWLGGYLRLRADRDLVMILIGDHQPPAAVSGERAGWEVPVHVIASRRAVLDPLLAHGFRSGVVPVHPALCRMHALTPLLLQALSSN